MSTQTSAVRAGTAIALGVLIAACGTDEDGPTAASAGQPGCSQKPDCAACGTCVASCVCETNQPDRCIEHCGGGAGGAGAGGATGGGAGAGGATGGTGGVSGAGGAGGAGAAGAGGSAGSPGAACQPVSGGPLAFPCAEGFGARATGGRGGDVYHVTTLADSGAGSLRSGIQSASGPRTIVFEVGGTISLESTLVIDNPNITIAGQTAPGDGITIRDYSVDIKNTHDIVVRFLRIRRGDVQVRSGSRPTGSAGLDTVSIDDSENIIFDHVSLSWSCDEIFGIVQNQNVTIQWSILSEPLGDPDLHPYGDNHAFGLNNSANTLSFHHSLVSNFVMRGPQFEANDATNAQGYDVFMESVNNVVFDYESSGSRYTTGIETNPSAASSVDFRFHFLNNFYIRAPSETAPEIQATTKHGVIDRLKVHVAGNLGPNRQNDSLDPWLGVFVEEGDVPIRQAAANIRAQMSDTPLFTAPVPITAHGAQQAYDLVVQHAGSSIKRDAVDLRVIDNVVTRKFSDYLRSQNEVGGWPALSGGTAPSDQDRDGMSDAWEAANGLNPSDAADRNGDADQDGYTNLEQYLESLVPPL